VNEYSFIFVSAMRTRDELKENAVKEKALDLFVSEGFDGLSMQKLAKAAGVSPATLYIYYKDRDDLIIQLWEEEMRKMTEATLQNFNPEMSFEEGLKIQWLNRARFFIANPKSMHFMEQIKYSPYHEICLQRMDKRFSDELSLFMRNAVSRGELVKTPIEVYWSIAFAPLYQLVKMHMLGRGIPPTQKFQLDEKIINQTLKLVLKALTP
jgi:TetR/AcrR family transcriptional regulator, multidrug resistance operon repressor